ncbi:MAG: hypothetical protein BWX80_04095 [Candidatus Hydrogenedentes bacterium ADurb.Bin101]|nr:MAG: hypothetical protein BWX80_04095 [Candidatus Hydrogenedentes bacterium ADurb.Bin101]
MTQVLFHVQHVKDNRSHGLDTGVHGAGQPRGPTALGGAGNDKAVNTDPGTVHQDGFRHVHGSDRGFYHGEQQRPRIPLVSARRAGLGIITVEELVETIGNGSVLGTFSQDQILNGNVVLNIRVNHFIGKYQGLARHIADIDDR